MHREEKKRVQKAKLIRGLLYPPSDPSQLTDAVKEGHREWKDIKGGVLYKDATKLEEEAELVLREREKEDERRGPSMSHLNWKDELDKVIERVWF